MMAMGALVVIAVLVAGSSYITLQESRLGQNSLVQARAFAMAEYGLNKIQADWDRTPNLQMENGASFDTTYTFDGQGGTAAVRYTRLNNETFWIISTGEAAANSALGKSRTAVKRMGAILRLRIPTIKANAAVTTGGDITVKGNPSVTGTNTSPTGWSGCATNGSPDTLSKAGIVVGPTATVTIQKADQVVGSPQSVERSEVATNAETYVQFGDETWNSLKIGAITIPGGVYGSDIQPVTTAGACNKSVTTNWGEPWRSGSGYTVECINYFPIIYSQSSLTLNGNGRGQGILLIEGDFKVNGTFEFYGLIVASGTLTAGNGTAKIYGAVMAASSTLVAGSDESNVSGTVDLYYSQCGLERSMRGSAQVVQARERAWAEIF